MRPFVIINIFINKFIESYKNKKNGGGGNRTRVQKVNNSCSTSLASHNAVRHAEVGILPQIVGDSVLVRPYSATNTYPLSRNLRSRKLRDCKAQGQALQEQPVFFHPDDTGISSGYSCVN